MRTNHPQKTWFGHAAVLRLLLAVPGATPTVDDACAAAERDHADACALLAAVRALLASLDA